MCENAVGTVCANDNNPLARVNYDPLARRQSVVYGNGTSSSFDFSARGDLEDLSWDIEGATDHLQYSFDRNGVGQITAKTMSATTPRWLPGANKSEAYQANGLKQYASIDGVPLVYDGNGNLTRDRHGKTFQYSAENHLMEIQDPAGDAIARNVYYADGQRRAQIRNPGPSQVSSLFYYTGDQEIMETGYTSGGLNEQRVLRRYVRLPGSVDEPIVMIDYGAGSGNPTSGGDNTNAPEVSRHYTY